MYLPIFGNDSAEDDDLLIACQVPRRSIVFQKPILVGRWGVGKTAIFFLQNNELSDMLSKVSDEHEKLWYIDHNTFDIRAIQEFLLLEIWDVSTVVRYFEAFWRAEIIRVYCKILETLKHEYRMFQEQHWKDVIHNARHDSTSKPIWIQVSRAAEALRISQDPPEEMDYAVKGLVDLFSDDLLLAVKKCLLNIETIGREIAVCIDPIETPKSDLEEHYPHIADSIVTSLLNAFNKFFTPSRSNPFVVRISIPWHRFLIDLMDSPQKIIDYKGDVEWSKKELREFINKRIEWEFKRVGRKYSTATRDAWSILFPKSVTNAICDPAITEDSFNYVLRHTHHRARDLQRFARRIVEVHSASNGVHPDEILSGQLEIDADAIQNTVRMEGPEVTKLLITEASRKYSKIQTLCDHLKGLSIPFSTSDLKNRAVNAKIDFNEALEILWDSGIIGITSLPETKKIASTIEAVFSKSKHRQSYQNAEKTHYSRWNWFELNSNDRPKEILERLRYLGESESVLVLHPMTFAYFAPGHIDNRAPIGL